MKTRLHLALAGMILAAISAGFAQPVITNQPQTQAVAPGTTATFTVGASGTEPLAYQWQRNLGTGFSALANCTNAVLMLTNAQPWDATDYRVVVTNLSGVRTSAVAHLYVMSPGLLTNRVVIDNFDDNKVTGYTLEGHAAQWFETNQQFTIRGYWPGVTTWRMIDTFAPAYLRRNWRLQDRQTLEWRVDLVGMNEHATSVAVEVVESAIAGGYVMHKGRDFMHLIKASTGPLNFSHVVHDSALIRNTNVVLAWALTRVSPNLILTARVLDKANQNAVLYERHVVDTPNVDRALTYAELYAASGMSLQAGSDIQAPPWNSFCGVGVVVWQYNYDGKRPAAEATFDNLELWTYKLPTTRYVDANGANATPPYTNWATAAVTIQDAVDAAAPGDEIVVTNGTYATGGRAVGTNVLVNRVAVDKPLTLRSVNGPQFTVIQGYQVPGTTNGDGAIRCAYLASGASLSGFTLTNGATRNVYAWPTSQDSIGGGLWCESTNGEISNCVLVGNSAYILGGGVSGGTLDNCTLAGNSVTAELGWGPGFCAGGGAGSSTLNNCTLTHNSATRGGGADSSTLNNCTVVGNSAMQGGGAADSALSNCALSGNSAGTRGGGAAYCTLNNCTLVNNSAAPYGGGADSSTLNNCTLTGNSASEFGGGVAGGTLYNCTLTGNSAGSYGGGAAPSVSVVVEQPCTLYNCIVYFNTAPAGANYHNGFFSGPAVMSYCCTTPMPTNGVGNITNAPLFVDYPNGNLRLQSNSPCINAGFNAYAPGPRDLDGNPRIVRGTVDIGAYEFQGPGSVISYAWLQHFGLPIDGTADFTDPDADGHATWQEWRCQTDPTNALSVLRLLSASSDGTSVTVTWQSVAGVSYFLERSANLSASPPFTLLAPNLPGQTNTTSFTDTNAARLAPLFYRAGVGN